MYVTQGQDAGEEFEHHPCNPSTEWSIPADRQGLLYIVGTEPAKGTGRWYQPDLLAVARNDLLIGAVMAVNPLPISPMSRPASASPWTNWPWDCPRPA